ncbi:amino acid ABC transporter ATP-binding protein (plasmid) [Thioclava sp. 'Guangxiensis']|uniref:amino acid ABC transporter ATP-binding protein n=1 Tax=Thioclava sp. 'Guangxiensis' TaxID=3149044 RepID=UPI0032C46E3F
MTQAMIDIRDLKKTFGQVQALKGLTMSVPRGEVVCLIGPSGSGKSTLLRCVNHLEQPSSGEVRVDGAPVGFVEAGGRKRAMNGRELAALRARIGMVFQHFYLWPHLSVIENIIAGPISVLGQSKEEAVAEAHRLLDKVGLAAKAGAYPDHLSGGQRQRVAIARAMAMRPKVMLFDEPTSALDPELVGEVLHAMEQIAAEGITMMVATHEMVFARRVAQKVVFMADGRDVEAADPQTLFDTPKSERLRHFLGQIL